MCNPLLSAWDPCSGVFPFLVKRSRTTRKAKMNFAEMISATDLAFPFSFLHVLKIFLVNPFWIGSAGTCYATPSLLAALCPSQAQDAAMGILTQPVYAEPVGRPWN